MCLYERKQVKGKGAEDQGLCNLIPVFFDNYNQMHSLYLPPTHISASPVHRVASVRVRGLEQEIILQLVLIPIYNNFFCLFNKGESRNAERRMLPRRPAPNRRYHRTNLAYSFPKPRLNDK